MPRHPNAIQGLATSLRQLAFFPARRDPAGEARLYVQRALAAAAEERYDVALVFCEKALASTPANLAARLLIARIYHHALEDLDRAVTAYRKVITLTGYDADDPYCAAARSGLDAVMRNVGEEPEEEEA